jgi:tRNA-binding protein
MQSDSISLLNARGIIVGDLGWAEFERVDLRVGTIVTAEVFRQARTPAIKLTIDFGGKIGIKKSSAQITDHYTPEDLVGKQISAVVNFPKKQIGPLMSECLVTGFTQPDGSIILAVPDKMAANGSRLA